MDYNKRPQVLIVTPKNYAVDIPTTLDTITIGFNTDLDVNFIAGNVILQDKNKFHVPTEVTYANRTITIKVKGSLRPDMTYQVMVIGDTNTVDTEVTGIRNIFGVAMAGIYQSTFTTVASQTLPAPKIIFPPNQVTVDQKPGFSWEEVAGATKYEVELSQSNTLAPKMWPSVAQTFTGAGPILPSITMNDGMYFWRMRAVDENDKAGEWTPVFTFNLDTVVEGTVTPEDTVPPNERMTYDPFLEEYDTEVLEAFPKDSSSNVDTKLKTISFLVMGNVALADIQMELFGESITGDEADHGIVPGTIGVEPQSDGTTLVTFTLEPVITA